MVQPQLYKDEFNVWFLGTFFLSANIWDNCVMKWKICWYIIILCFDNNKRNRFYFWYYTLNLKINAQLYNSINFDPVDEICGVSLPVKNTQIIILKQNFRLENITFTVENDSTSAWYKQPLYLIGCQIGNKRGKV